MPNKKMIKEMLKYYSRQNLNRIVDSTLGITLAHKLAKTGNWTTNDKQILMLRDKSNCTVAHYLAKYNPNWTTNDKQILMLRDKFFNTVAHYLASYNPNWITYDTKILKKHNLFGDTVAHRLANNNPSWSCYKKKILNLGPDYNGKTVHLYLEDKKKYISTKHKKNVLTFIPIV